MSDVERAVRRAHEAQAEWAATSYAVRAAVLRRAADVLEQHEAEIADWAIRESGIPRYGTSVAGSAESSGPDANLDAFTETQWGDSAATARRIPLLTTCIRDPARAPPRPH